MADFHTQNENVINSPLIRLRPLNNRYSVRQKDKSKKTIPPNIRYIQELTKRQNDNSASSQPFRSAQTTASYRKTQGFPIRKIQKGTIKKKYQIIRQLKTHNQNIIKRIIGNNLKKVSFSPFPISTEIEKILPVKGKATPFMPDGIALQSTRLHPFGPMVQPFGKKNKSFGKLHGMFQSKRPLVGR